MRMCAVNVSMMPSGVEHSKLRKTLAATRVNVSMMPSGVEHRISRRWTSDDGRVNVSMMPSGVEHEKSSAGPTNRVTSECFYDAVRR